MRSIFWNERERNAVRIRELAKGGQQTHLNDPMTLDRLERVSLKEYEDCNLREALQLIRRSSDERQEKRTRGGHRQIDQRRHYREQVQEHDGSTGALDEHDDRLVSPDAFSSSGLRTLLPFWTYSYSAEQESSKDSR